ncbi:histone deacetylase 8-like [Babylonia areolata]|uniref:histone deacetylase 8-like n=1 Tax=Babylonia areolata TaxID=304850 RepID=UPI003FD64123
MESSENSENKKDDESYLEKTNVEDASEDPKDNNQNVRNQRETNVKRHYHFDELDDEPFQQPKLRKFERSVSDIGNHLNKTDQLTKNVKDGQEFHQQISRKDHSPPDIEKIEQSKLENGNIPHETDTNERAVDEHEDASSGTDPSGCNKSNTNSCVPSLDQNKTQEKSQQKSACHRVVFIHSDQLITHCNRLPRIPDRAGMVYSLIESLGLLTFLHVVAPKTASEEEVLKFHSKDYVEFLQRISHLEDEEKIDVDDAEQYGITYDCPVQENVYECAALVAGATVTAAKALCDKQCHIAINWCGGWHHAQRSEASGFCYINDIVLGILTLRDKFSRVLYVDLDLHHGDGVENAFSTTPHVLTVSFHKYDTGFFPGSGSILDVGSRGGKYYCVNVPMKDGLSDKEFFAVFKRVMTAVRETYDPEVVVCQCGADGLAEDPMSSFNLTLTAFRHCLYFLMLWELPLLLLGGGGYHHANTARCWASLTALTVGRKLPQDVPDHKHFTEYGPDYELTVQAGNRKDDNSLKDLVKICSIITENLQNIKGKLV